VQLRAVWQAERALGDRTGACADGRRLMELPDLDAPMREAVTRYLAGACAR
jgi:hypothetical protein